MTHIDTKDWVIDGAWKIAPAGLSWIAEGSKIQVGYGATIGYSVTIGDRVTIGRFATIGACATIRACAAIGNNATIGDHTEESFEVGFADGYIKTICMVKGVAYIGAGCRWFTLAEALIHWKTPGREMTMCLMQSAIAIAILKGWRFDNDSN